MGWNKWWHAPNGRFEAFFASEKELENDKKLYFVINQTTSYKQTSSSKLITSSIANPIHGWALRTAASKLLFHGLMIVRICSCTSSNASSPHLYNSAWSVSRGSPFEVHLTRSEHVAGKWVLERRTQEALVSSFFLFSLCF